MKRLIACAAVCVLAASAFGQGTVQMANTSTTTVKYASGTAAGNNSQVQLAWAPNDAVISAWIPELSASAWLAANPSMSLVGTPVTLLGSGRFTSSTPVTIAGIAPGSIVQAVIFGWTGTGAANALAGYDLAASQPQSATTGQFGISSVFRVDTGDPTTVPPGTAGNIVTSISGQGFAGMTMAPAVVPEPSSMLLAGLGAAALLIFRRRN